MKIFSITSSDITNNMNHRGKPKIPQHCLLKEKEKAENINALKLAKIFEDFEESFRDTMETFIYMIKY